MGVVLAEEIIKKYMNGDLRQSFFDWANGSSERDPGGLTGGNKEAPIWFCGLEWGGVVASFNKQDLKDINGLDALFDIDKSQKGCFIPRFYLGLDKEEKDTLIAIRSKKHDYEGVNRALGNADQKILINLFHVYYTNFFKNNISSFQNQKKQIKDYPWIGKMNNLYGKLSKIMLQVIINSQVLQQKLGEVWSRYKEKNQDLNGTSSLERARKYFIERLFDEAGETYGINMWPLPIAKCNQEQWKNSSYPWLTGHTNKGDYIKNLGTRYAKLREMISNGREKVLVCFGSTYADEFNKYLQLGIDLKSSPREQGCYYGKKDGLRIIISPWPNSNILIENLGKKIAAFL